MNTRWITVEVQDQTMLEYGKKVYVIEAVGSQTFQSVCPICDDTKKVTIRGQEFDCPYCNSYRYGSIVNNRTRIEMRNYQPVEYIINEMWIRGEETKSAYKGYDLPVARIRFVGFTKKGNSDRTTRTRNFYDISFDNYGLESCDVTHDRSGAFSFKKKSEAVAVAKMMHEQQAELLKKFNEENGTNHEYPFEY